MNGSALGRLRWSVSAGHVPSASTGREPEFTSFDLISLLNTGDEMANVRVMVLYANHPPTGPYMITVAPRRARRLRINDLIFPEAVRLDQDYGLQIESDLPVVAHFGRQDTRLRQLATFVSTACPLPPRWSPR
jgi:hypothetical protein